ncbi:MAG: hypothetical protein IPO28_13120 [Holophagaceae bacterium]|nr:hypothetical protein [Holophagaceae bacterium]
MALIPHGVDTAAGSITGTQAVTVGPAAASPSHGHRASQHHRAGVSHTFTVTALDRLWQYASGCVGTILTSSGCLAIPQQ